MKIVYKKLVCFDGRARDDLKMIEELTGLYGNGAIRYALRAAVLAEIEKIQNRSETDGTDNDN